MQRDAATNIAIPVIEEQLQVGKREVQRGGVRVYSHIVETPVQENVSLREEHVNVERRPSNQPVNTADAALFKEQSIELRETAEEAVVQKSARVVEEVVISKNVSERQESINDTVRHTVVDVEQLGAPGATSDAAYRSHFASNYGTTGQSYESYAPAYSFGGEMGKAHKGRRWDDVEGEVRTQWDSRNAGSASTWEQAKGAIQHAWNNATK